MAVRVALAVAVALAGCVVPAETTTSTASTTTTTPETTATTGPQTDPTDPILACGDREGRFVEEGTVPPVGVGSSDAGLVSGLRWETIPGCERVLVTFATPEGAPAVEAPVTGGSFLRSAGVMRLTLSGTIQGSSIADQVVDTDLVDRAYVVTAVDGTVSVDIHLAAPAFARVRAQASPGAVIVDLIAGGSEYPRRPVREEGVVVVEPAAAEITYPLTIGGYIGPEIDGADTVGAVLVGEGASERAEGAVGEHRSTWGGFSAVFASGPTGPVTVTVRDRAAVFFTVR
jgi:hypothetical protein